MEHNPWYVLLLGIVVSFLYDMYMADVSRKKKDMNFSFNIYLRENWTRVILSVVAPIFLIAIGPALTEMANVPWNILFTGIVALMPLPILRKLKSRVNAELREKAKKV